MRSTIVIEQVQAVGTYALQFQWSDGHYTGIYTWTYLRSADPEAPENHSASDDGS